MSGNLQKLIVETREQATYIQEDGLYDLKPKDVAADFEHLASTLEALVSKIEDIEGLSSLLATERDSYPRNALDMDSEVLAMKVAAYLLGEHP